MIPCYTRVISERFRDQLGIIKRYRNGLFTLLTLLLLQASRCCVRASLNISHRVVFSRSSVHTTNGLRAKVYHRADMCFPTTQLDYELRLRAADRERSTCFCTETCVVLVCNRWCWVLPQSWSCIEDGAVCVVSERLVLRWQHWSTELHVPNLSPLRDGRRRFL